jgi:hypothetical protein
MGVRVTAGDRGAVLQINAGGYNLLGSTCALLAAPGRANTRARALTLTPVVVAEDGMTASYTQTGTDFTEGGFWQLQLQIQTPDGQQLTSPQGRLYIFPRLTS